MATLKSTSARSAPTRKNHNGSSWEEAGAAGSLAHRLSESPGGIEGALKRLKGAPRGADLLTRFKMAIGEEPQP